MGLMTPTGSFKTINNINRLTVTMAAPASKSSLKCKALACDKTILFIQARTPTCLVAERLAIY